MHDERAPGQLLPGESHGYCHETTRRVRNCPMEMCQTLGRCCANAKDAALPDLKPRTDVLVDTSPASPPPLVLKGGDRGSPLVLKGGDRGSPLVVDEYENVDWEKLRFDQEFPPMVSKKEEQAMKEYAEEADKEIARQGGSRADSPLLDALEITHVDPSVKHAGRQGSALAKGLARENAAMRGFETGAMRSSDAGRIDPEGFMNPLVVEAFCNYMSKHRVQADGNLRASDNWQKGMPRETAIKGMFRHFMHLWTRHRGLPVTDEKAAANIMEDLCAIRFNVDVYLWEIIRENIAKTGRPW